MEAVEQKREEWAENRRRVIDRIREIARELDGWHLGDNIANVAGSSVGVVGGSLLLGGLAFPPLLIPGLAMTLIGAGGKIGTSVTRMAVVKNLAAEAQRLCEDDARLLSAFLEEAETLLAACAGVGAATFALNGLTASVSVLRHTFITVTHTSLKALLPAAAVAPIRALAGVTAGIGMALDVFSLITSTQSLASNETDDLAQKLRLIANQLEEELNAAIAAQTDNKE